MKPIILISIGISAFSAAFSSCGDPAPKQPQQPVVQEPAKPVQTTNVQLETNPSSTGSTPVPPGQMTPLELTTFLPGTLEGAALESPSAGKSRRSETSVWTKASGQYNFGSAGAVFISITDFGGELPEDMQKRFTPPFNEPGLTVEKLITPDGSGYKLFNEHSKTGNIAILVKGRIGIEIEVVKYSGTNFDKFASAVNVSALAKAAEKKK